MYGEIQAIADTMKVRLNDKLRIGKSTLLQRLDLSNKIAERSDSTTLETLNTVDNEAHPEAPSDATTGLLAQKTITTTTMGKSSEDESVCIESGASRIESENGENI
jgi:hypothetical protein